MIRPDCEKEPQVLEATRSGLWDEELRGHISCCQDCAESAISACYLRQLERIDRNGADLPGAGQMWWKLQLRARREAVERAARPISYFQSITLIFTLLAFVGVSFWQWDKLRAWSGTLLSLCRIIPSPLQDFAANVWKSWNIILVAGAGAAAILVTVAMWLSRPED